MADLGDGIEPISDHEVLYRRIPLSENWYDPQISPHPSPKAFRPRPDDTTGLSIVRGRYTKVEDVAVNPRGSLYYVAELRAGDLRQHGIEVVPAPREDDPGHAEIINLSYENRGTDQAEELQVLLARTLCIRVHGPFP